MRCAHGDYGYLFRCPNGCGQTPVERYEENARNIGYFLKREALARARVTKP